MPGQQKYRVDWDATDEQCGRSCRRWRGTKNSRKSKPGSCSLGFDLAKAFERVSFPMVWALLTHFSFPRKILRVLCEYFEHQRRVQFEGGGAAPDHHGHLATVEVELLASA